MNEEVPHYREQEDNARLLAHLVREFGASGVGDIINFCAVRVYWHCPSCNRDKRRIARLNKNGALNCPLHEHHDHFEDYVFEKLAWVRNSIHQIRDEVKQHAIHSTDWRSVRDIRDTEQGRYYSLKKGLARFPRTLICGDCNVAEPAAKKIVEAPAEFSFAPFEIAQFIIVSDHSGHRLDADKVVEVFEAAKPSMRLLYKRLFSISSPERAEASGWQSLAQLSWNIAAETNRKRKNGEDAA